MKRIIYIMLVALLSIIGTTAWGQTNRTLGNIPQGWTVTADGQNVTVTEGTATIPAGAEVLLFPPAAEINLVKSVTLTDAPATSCRLINLDTIQHDFVAQNCDTLTGTLAANVKISIAAGATVTLDGVTINGEDLSDCNWSGITCEGDATIILKDETTNTVTGFRHDYPGIFVPQNKTLTIKGETAGTGSLTASSNVHPAEDCAAGIGAGYGNACGNILIESGTIAANGGNRGAGIGGAVNASCGTITINGGTVDATGGAFGAGIGSGGEISSSSDPCGTITITGGTVIATGGEYGAGIGSGDIGKCQSISITGGTVIATGGSKATGIGSGNYGTCADITITNGVTQVTAIKGSSATNSIGAGYNGTCGTVTIGGTVYYQNNAYVGTGSTYLTQSPLIYPAKTAAQATTEDLGKVIGADGRIYADAAAATAAGTTAVALICYVGNDAETNTTYNHGLALALTDANDGNKAAWCSLTTGGYCLTAQYNYTENAITDMAGIANTDTLIDHAPDGHTHTAATAARNYKYNNSVAEGTHPTGTSAWFLPSAGQWYKMINACMNVLGANNDHRDLRDGFITRGGTNLQQNIYRTSTQGHPGFSYCFQFNEGYWTGPNKEFQYYVRSALAF